MYMRFEGERNVMFAGTNDAERDLIFRLDCYYHREVFLTVDLLLLWEWLR